MTDLLARREAARIAIPFQSADLTTPSGSIRLLAQSTSVSARGAIAIPTAGPCRPCDAAFSQPASSHA